MKNSPSQYVPARTWNWPHNKSGSALPIRGRILQSCSFWMWFLKWEEVIMDDLLVPSIFESVLFVTVCTALSSCSLLNRVCKLPTFSKGGSSFQLVKFLFLSLNSYFIMTRWLHPFLEALFSLFYLLILFFKYLISHCFRFFTDFLSSFMGTLYKLEFCTIDVCDFITIPLL